MAKDINLMRKKEVNFMLSEEIVQNVEEMAEFLKEHLDCTQEELHTFIDNFNLYIGYKIVYECAMLAVHKIYKENQYLMFDDLKLMLSVSIWTYHYSKQVRCE